MAEPIKIDSHVHIFPTAAEGQGSKDAYEIWEYGAQDSVHFSDLAGTVAEIEGAMAEAGISRAIAVNLFLANEERQAYRARLPEEMDEERRRAALSEFEARLGESLKAFNRWACRVAREHPSIVAYVGADVTLMPGEEGAAHLRDLVENEGARGVKLHGPAQGFFMGDERLWPIYAACRDLGAPVIAHSGPDTGGRGFAEPRAFGAVLEAFPELPIVLAHMGGATWAQAREVAATYPNAYFDCCEIIEWTHSDNGPSDQELAALIQDIGPQRVMMGSDYPWYDLDHTVERVMELPLLSQEEKEGILGANAVKILSL
jgi:predicted TIM-barrel fold metal-dependent hydrolase